VLSPKSLLIISESLPSLRFSDGFHTAPRLNCSDDTTSFCYGTFRHDDRTCKRHGVRGVMVAWTLHHRAASSRVLGSSCVKLRRWEERDGILGARRAANLVTSIIIPAAPSTRSASRVPGLLYFCTARHGCAAVCQARKICSGWYLSVLSLADSPVLFRDKRI
jgi:hypothetical protein